MKNISMTTKEQQAIMDFIAIYNAYAQLVTSSFSSPEDTQKSIRLASNNRILAAVLEHSKDVVDFKDLRTHLVELSDPLVTRWKMLLPQPVLKELEQQDRIFKAFATEQLVENGLTAEEAGIAVGKIIPFPVKDGE